MHLFLIIGIFLLSISSFCSLWGLLLSYEFYKKNNLRIFFFNLVSLGWSLLSILYRVNEDFTFVKPILLVVGIFLAVISFLWFDISLQFSNFGAKSRRQLKIVFAVILILLVANNSFSQVADNLQIIKTGLIRYKLSLEGSLLFSFSFLLIFFGNILQLLNFKSHSLGIKLSNFFRCYNH